MTRSVLRILGVMNLIFGIALAIGFGVITGLRFLAIDDAEILDGKNRPAVAKMLSHALETGLLEQAILIATADEAPDGCVSETRAAYWVEEGSIHGLPVQV